MDSVSSDRSAPLEGRSHGFISPEQCMVPALASTQLLWENLLPIVFIMVTQYVIQVMCKLAFLPQNLYHGLQIG